MKFLWFGNIVLGVEIYRYILVVIKDGVYFC